MTAKIDTIATQLLLQQLVKGGHLELEGDPEDSLAALVDVVTEWLALHGRDRNGADKLGLFLEKHPLVAETYADAELLAEKLAVWEQATRRFAKPVEHRDPGLEQQILDNLDDDAARLVYADVLQQHGDPLGELVTRQASNNARAVKKLLSEHGEFFFGPAEEYLRLFKIEYHLGFIRSIAIARKQRIELEWPVVTRWLLERPIARFVEHITIGPLPEPRREEVAVWDAVLAAPRIALRSITFVSKMTRLADSLELAQLANAPRVQDVRIEGARVAAAPFEHAALRRLDIKLEQVAELSASLGDSTLPALEELAISAAWSTTARTFWPRAAPALRVLRIASATPVAIVEALAADPILPQLAELELANVDSDAAHALTTNAERFAHLKLSLPSNALQKATLQRLRGVVPLS